MPRKTIDIGTNSRNTAFTLPVEILTETTSIIGRRGSGKTNTGVRIIESLLGEGHQIVVLDPLDVWWGLKSSDDGKQSGRDVLLLGDGRKPHTDLPLVETEGRAIADFVVSERVPVILSMRHLSKSKRRRLALDFLERFYERKGDPGLDTPVLVAIDEASQFVPQRVLGEDARLVGAVENCVRQGRASGIGVMLIDQRPASVNKDVLTQTELMVTHQLTGPQDKKALKEWIEDNAGSSPEESKRFLTSLAGLGTGEAWFWSPAWLQCFEQVQVNLRETFDSSKTPKVGQAPPVAANVASFDLDAIQKKFSNSVEKAKADDPKELRKRIADLERKLQSQPPVVDEGAIEQAVAERDRHWQAELGKATKSVAALTGRIEKIGTLCQLNGEVYQASAPPVHQAVHQSEPKPETTARKPSKTRSPLVGDSANTGDLSKAERLILRALYWCRNEQATSAKIGFYSGYSHKSGGFNNALSKLRSKGLLEGWQITAAGADVAATYAEAKPSGMELREWLRPKLPKASNEILDVLIDADGERLDNATIAARTESGYSPGSGGFNNALSKLRSLEAAEGGANQGGTRAADVFFE